MDNDVQLTITQLQKLILDTAEDVTNVKDIEGADILQKKIRALSDALCAVNASK
jgi:hypothetical protein